MRVLESDEFKKSKMSFFWKISALYTVIFCLLSQADHLENIYLASLFFALFSFVFTYTMLQKEHVIDILNKKNTINILILNAALLIPGSSILIYCIKGLEPYLNQARLDSFGFELFSFLEINCGILFISYIFVLINAITNLIIFCDNIKTQKIFCEKNHSIITYCSKIMGKLSLIFLFYLPIYFLLSLCIHEIFKTNPILIYVFIFIFPFCVTPILIAYEINQILKIEKSINEKKFSFFLNSDEIVDSEKLYSMIKKIEKLDVEELELEEIRLQKKINKSMQDKMQEAFIYRQNGKIEIAIKIITIVLKKLIRTNQKKSAIYTYYEFKNERECLNLTTQDFINLSLFLKEIDQNKEATWLLYKALEKSDFDITEKIKNSLIELADDSREKNKKTEAYDLYKLFYQNFSGSELNKKAKREIEEIMKDKQKTV